MTLWISSERAKALLLMVLVGVALPANAWHRVDGQALVSKPKGRVLVRPPEGWMCDDSRGDGIVVTRDGELLNSVHVSLRRHRKAFEKPVRVDTSRDTPPETLAQLYIAELKDQEDVREVEVVSIEAAVLAGLPAFRVHLTFRVDGIIGGARYEKLIVGTAVEHGVLAAEYAAPRLHFYAKSLPSFEAMVTSVEVLPRRRREPGDDGCHSYPGRNDRVKPASTG